MPRGHKVSVRDSSVKLTQCNAAGNCTLSSSSVMTYTHYPDLDNYRYRIDFHQEYPLNNGPFPEGTTLGFITDKVTKLGYEYMYNSTDCSCRKTTTPSGIYHITCVTDEFVFDRPINIGVGLKAQLYHLKQTKKSGNTRDEIYTDNVAQIFDDDQSVPLCALIHEETTSRSFDSNTGSLQALSTRTIECSDFTPHASDSSYVVPSYCPAPCG
jgi:hypothetical protein